MADKYSVIYDPVDKVPFAIIRDSGAGLIAHPIQASANQWAAEYNGGRKQVPHGMTSSEFVEMNCDFVDSFKSAFGRSERVSRRAQILSSPKETRESAEIVYGVGFVGATRRKLGTSRKVMPVIGYLQKELFRTKAIDRAIRTGKRWLRKNSAA